MKVVFITTSLSEENGWGKYSLEIVRRLPALGIEPVVIAQWDAGTAAPAGVSVHPLLSSFSEGRSKLMRVLRDWLRTRHLVRNAVAVHCLAEPFIPLAHLLARRCPLFITVVGTYCESVLDGMWASLYRMAYRRAAAVPSISRYTASRVVGRMPELTPKIRVIPLGVTALDDFARQPASGRERAFLMVGEVKPRKGTLQAVEALAQVLTEVPEARLFIAGQKPRSAYVEEIEARISALGLSEHVVWTGKVTADELEALYRRVRGLVMPSMNAGASFEGFGLVHLEANAYGTPAIGSLGCGNEDAIADGTSGYLVPQGDVAALAAKMIRLLGPDEEWERMSVGAHDFARSMNWDRVARAYAAMYLMSSP